LTYINTTTLTAKNMSNFIEMTVSAALLGVGAFTATTLHGCKSDDPCAGVKNIDDAPECATCLEEELNGNRSPPIEEIQNAIVACGGEIKDALNYIPSGGECEPEEFFQPGRTCMACVNTVCPRGINCNPPTTVSIPTGYENAYTACVFRKKK
jgi:hypothetical protein